MVCEVQSGAYSVGTDPRTTSFVTEENAPSVASVPDGHVVRTQGNSPSSCGHHGARLPLQCSNVRDQGIAGNDHLADAHMASKFRSEFGWAFEEARHSSQPNCNASEPWLSDWACSSRQQIAYSYAELLMLDYASRSRYRFAIGRAPLSSASLTSNANAASTDIDAGHALSRHALAQHSNRTAHTSCLGERSSAPRDGPAGQEF